MCHVCFSQWMHDKQDEPVHRGAAIARSLGIPVDPEPEEAIMGEDTPEIQESETKPNETEPQPTNLIRN